MKEQPVNPSSKLIGTVVDVRGKNVVEVGINYDDAEAWPIAVSLIELKRHFFLTRTMARALADVLTETADAVDVQCSRCPEVEVAKIHDRASGKWEHDYDEQVIA